jgi:hypothetical protein
LLLGVAGSALILIGKFYFSAVPPTYTGITMLLAAALWNAWPRRMVESGHLKPRCCRGKEIVKNEG